MSEFELVDLLAPRDQRVTCPPGDRAKASRQCLWLEDKGVAHHQYDPRGDLHSGCPALATRFHDFEPVRTALVDSNSTRTESCVAIRPDLNAQIQVDAPEAADHNGHPQIIRPSRGMRAGLKILVSAVQSRPSPPFFSAAYPSENFSRSEFVPRFVPDSGTLPRIPAHQDRVRRESRRVWFESLCSSVYGLLTGGGSACMTCRHMTRDGARWSSCWHFGVRSVCAT
jgi:hypothetical protein